jgi:hypothetical protein
MVVRRRGSAGRKITIAYERAIQTLRYKSVYFQEREINAFSVVLGHRRAIAAVANALRDAESSLSPSLSPSGTPLWKSALLQVLEFFFNFYPPSSHAWTSPTPKYNRTKIESE